MSPEPTAVSSAIRDSAPRARLIAVAIAAFIASGGCQQPRGNPAVVPVDAQTRELLANSAGLDATQPIDITQLGQFVEINQLERTENIDASQLRLAPIVPKAHSGTLEPQPPARKKYR